jgi:DNA-binding GntR family transcriptional regulator
MEGSGKGNEKAYLAWTQPFHQLIFEHAGNHYLTASYTRYVGKIAALRTHLAKLPQHTESVVPGAPARFAAAVRKGNMMLSAPCRAHRPNPSSLQERHDRPRRHGRRLTPPYWLN